MSSFIAFILVALIFPIGIIAFWLNYNDPAITDIGKDNLTIADENNMKGVTL